MDANEKVVSLETGKLDLKAMLQEVELEKKSTKFENKQATQANIADLLQIKHKKKKKKKK